MTTIVNNVLAQTNHDLIIHHVCQTILQNVYLSNMHIAKDKLARIKICIICHMSYALQLWINRINHNNSKNVCSPI